MPNMILERSIKEKMSRCSLLVLDACEHTSLSFVQGSIETPLASLVVIMALE